METNSGYELLMQSPCNLPRKRAASSKRLLTRRRWSCLWRSHPGLQEHWQRAGMHKRWTCVFLDHFLYFLTLKTPTVEAKWCKWANARWSVATAPKWPIFAGFPRLTTTKMADSLAVARTLSIRTIWNSALREVKCPDAEGFEEAFMDLYNS